MKTSSRFAIIAAAGILAGGMMTPAVAGGLGDDCCVDLEDRVAELEATTVRKGNRKVSVKIYGFVTRALMYWDDSAIDNALTGNRGSRSDLYQVDIAQSGISRWGIKGGARINHDVSVGYKFEWQIGDTYANQTSPSDDDGVEAEGLALRHSVIHVTSRRMGTISIGHSHTASDSVAQIDLSGTTFFARSNVNSTLIGGGSVSGALFNNLDGGGRGDRVRYDSPKLRGFVVSASFGESDYWDVALRYAGQIRDFQVAAGIAYITTEDDSSGTGDSGACGNVSGGSSILQQECIVGSGGILHTPTGLNINFAAGQSSVDTGPLFSDIEYNYWYVKGGILKNFFGVGKTGAYVEYWESDFDFPLGSIFDTSGTMWGIGVVQNFDSAVFQVFLSHRNYEEDTHSLVDATGDDSSTTLFGFNIRF